MVANFFTSDHQTFAVYLMLDVKPARIYVVVGLYSELLHASIKHCFESTYEFLLNPIRVLIILILLSNFISRLKFILQSKQVKFQRIEVQQSTDKFCCICMVHRWV